MHSSTTIFLYVQYIAHILKILETVLDLIFIAFQKNFTDSVVITRFFTIKIALLFPKHSVSVGHRGCRYFGGNINGGNPFQPTVSLQRGCRYNGGRYIGGSLYFSWKRGLIPKII